MKKYKYSKKKLADFTELMENEENTVGLFYLYEKIVDPKFIPNDFYLLIMERPELAKGVRQEPIKILINKEKDYWEVLKINNKSLKVIGTFETFNILIRELILMVFED